MDRPQEPVSVFVAPAGAFGTAIALASCQAGNRTTLYFRSSNKLTAAQRTQKSERLPGHSLKGVTVTGQLEHCAASELIMAAPRAQYARELLEEIQKHCRTDATLVLGTKGIEQESQSRMSDVVASIFGDDFLENKCAFLSGPSFAEQLAANDPTCVVVASYNPATAQTVRRALSTQTFRIYTSDDVAGVELCGICKNIIAIAAGIIKGMGLNDNANAALFTRGLTEIARFVLSQGGHCDTIYGLAGAGDLHMTCSSSTSRNFGFGYALGVGHHQDILSFVEAFEENSGVVEGYHSIPTILHIAQDNGIELPIIAMLAEVLYRGYDPQTAVIDLMNRPPKAERNPVTE